MKAKIEMEKKKVGEEEFFHSDCFEGKKKKLLNVNSLSRVHKILFARMISFSDSPTRRFYDCNLSS